jgi:hypothetical protein
LAKKVNIDMKKRLNLFEKVYSELLEDYSELVVEDYQSFRAEARKILGSVHVNDAEQALAQIESVYNSVRNQEAKTDYDIVGLAFLALATQVVPTLEAIRTEYNNYCDTPSLYRNKTLSKWANDVKNGIKQGRLYTPEKKQEKINFLNTKATELVEKIHQQYVRPENKQSKEDPTEVTEKPKDKLVYDNGQIEIYLGDSMVMCQLLGKGTNLCISERDRRSNYYWRYRFKGMKSSGMTTYFAFNKGDKFPFVVIDSHGDEYGADDEYAYTNVDSKTGRQTGDAYNLPKESVIEKYPMLKDAFDKDVFKFIEYGENEKKYRDIEERIEDILDPRLTEYEDYDMFVQTGKDVEDSAWDKLPIDINSKKDLVKKYMGIGGYVSRDTFRKYADKNDYDWYIQSVTRHGKPETGLKIAKDHMEVGREVPEKIIDMIAQDPHTSFEYVKILYSLDDEKTA